MDPKRTPINTALFGHKATMELRLTSGTRGTLDARRAWQTIGWRSKSPSEPLCPKMTRCFKKREIHFGICAFGTRLRRPGTAQIQAFRQHLWTTELPEYEDRSVTDRQTAPLLGPMLAAGG